MNFQEYFIEYNFWHENAKINSKYLGKKRESYVNKILNKFSSSRILAILGVRRSGKSTLMFQVIDELLKKGVNSKKILYVKIDDFNYEISDFDEIIKAYEIYSGFSVKNDDCYIFIDEIQKLKNWQNQLKKYIDYKYNSQFIISGSSKTLIYKDATESLMGRIRFVNVFPLTFREFLEFYDINLTRISPDSQLDIKKINDFKNKIYDKTKIIYYFNLYLNVGGFPEWFTVNDKLLWKNILKEEYVDLFLAKDIVDVYNIKNYSSLRYLFILLSKNSGNRFSYNKISDKLDINRDTVKSYINFLNSSGMIYISDKFTKNSSINEKSEKKIYVWEEGLRRALSFTFKDDFSYENILTWHLQKFGLEFDSNFQPKYYHKKYEVDYILELNNNIIPIEVKNTSNKVNIKGVKEFMNQFNSNKGIVITKDRFEIENDIYFIPIWLFLLYIS